MEGIHVELPHERREVVVLEVLREEFLREIVGLSDHERITALRPSNDFMIFRVLQEIGEKRYVQNLKGFLQELRHLRVGVLARSLVASINKCTVSVLEVRLKIYGIVH